MAAAYSLVPVVRYMQELHTALAGSPVEAAAPTVVGMAAAGVVHMAVEAAGPIVAHIEMEAARREVEVAHMGVAVPDLAADLDHMTWMIPSCRILVFPS